MSTWPSKDPDAILDYVYRIPLDEGDSVTAHTFSELTGTVAIENDPGDLAAAPDTTAAGYGQNVTVRLSGGADGETAVFQIGWTTAGGRTDDDVITLFVSSHEYDALALTGYAKPLPPHLKQRYPAFADVDAGTVQYWLTDAERSVDTSWSEGDYAAGLMALAAHNMALAGYGTDAAKLAVIPAGVSRFKSGSLDVTLTDASANARMGASYDSTRYGQEYLALLRRNRGGPLVGDTGALPTPGYPYPAGYPY
jgi:hypothetical protein